MQKNNLSCRDGISSYLDRCNNFYIIFVILLVLFGATMLLQDRYSFEDEIYTNGALSAISRGDFNIINQNLPPGRKWLVTTMGYYPNQVQVASISFLVPFFLIHKAVINPTVLNSGDFIFAHTLAVFSMTIICWLIFFLILVRYVSKENAIRSMIIIFFSTSFFLHFFFSITAPNMIGASFSVVVFSLYNLTSKNKKSIFTWFFWGAVAAFGFALRIQLFWMGFYFVYNLKGQRKKDWLTFFLGAGLFSLFFMLNSYVKNGALGNTYYLPLLNNDFLYFAQRSFVYYLVGPNGFLAISPIYLVLALATVYVLKNPSSKPQRSFLMMLLAAPVILYLTYSTAWPIEYYFIGRQQLEYLFIYIIILGLYLDGLGLNSKGYKTIIILCGVFSIWHVFVTCIFLQDIAHTSQWYYRYLYFDWAEILKMFNGITWRISLNITRISQNYKIFFYIIPILLIEAKIIHNILNKKINTAQVSKTIIGTGMIICILITASGFYKSLSPRQLPQDAVVGNNGYIFWYDDYVESIRKIMYFYLARNNCIAVSKLDTLLDSFIIKVKEGVVYDPVDFVKNLDRGILRQSYWDDSVLVEKLNRERIQKCPGLLGHSKYLHNAREDYKLAP